MTVDTVCVPTSKMVELGKAATYINGKAFKPEQWSTEGLPIIRIENLNKTGAYFNYYSGDLEEKYLVKNGDLLVSWSASLDAFIWDRGNAALNQHIFKVVENPEIVDRGYLFFCLKAVMQEIRDQTHGATMKHINKPEFEAFKIPLPPLPEQKRIAAILTERLAAVEQARKASEARLEAARALPAAYLREVFESEEARGWHKTRLGELIISSLRTGISKPEKFDSGKKCLTLSAVRNGSLLLDQVKSVDVTDSEAARNGLKAGVFYVVRGNGNRSLVGRGGIAPKQCDGVIFPDLLFEVNPNPNILLIEFLRWAWDSQSVRSQIEEKAKTAAGIYKINQQNLASIALPIPPLLIQKQVATVLSNKISKVADVQKMIFDELAIVGAMSASYLRQAFSGLL